MSVAAAIFAESPLFEVVDCGRKTVVGAAVLKQRTLLLCLALSISSLAFLAMNQNVRFPFVLLTNFD